MLLYAKLLLYFFILNLTGLVRVSAPLNEETMAFRVHFNTYSLHLCRDTLRVIYAEGFLKNAGIRQFHGMVPMEIRHHLLNFG